MSDNNISADTDFGLLAIALLFICFCGEPDLIDALIYFLMNAK